MRCECFCQRQEDADLLVDPCAGLDFLLEDEVKEVRHCLSLAALRLGPVRLKQMLA